MSRGEEVFGDEGFGPETRRASCTPSATNSNEESDEPRKAVRRVSPGGQFSGKGIAVPVRRAKLPEKTLKRKLKRHSPGLSTHELELVFAFIANGKVTLGRAEFEQTVERLDLDIGSDAIEAAFELLAASGHAGPCVRVTQQQFTAFMSEI